MIYAMSDIHGMYRKFKKMLEDLEYQKNEVNSTPVGAELAKVEHLTIEKDILTEEQKKILHI